MSATTDSLHSRGTWGVTRGGKERPTILDIAAPPPPPHLLGVRQRRIGQAAPPVTPTKPVVDTFDEKGSRWALIWTLATSVMLGLFSLIGLDLCIAFQVPAWPASTYAYGYVLSAFTYFTWPIFLAVAPFRNVDLTKAAFFLALLQLIINTVVFVLQVVGAISGLINLEFTTTITGLVISFVLEVLSALLFYSLLDLVIKFFHSPRRSNTPTPQSLQSNLQWILSFGIFNSLVGLVSFGIGLAYGIPAWPTTSATYYGWVLSSLNWVTAFLYAAIYTRRNPLLTQVTFWVTVAQSLVNLIVYLVQLGAGLDGVLNLNASKNLYSITISTALLVLSTVPLVALTAFLLPTLRKL